MNLLTSHPSTHSIPSRFFFRGQDGAYSFSDTRAKSKMSQREREHVKKYWKKVDGEDYDPDCGEVCHVLKGLEALVANKKYKDWLFLFGTVIVSESLPQEDQFGKTSDRLTIMWLETTMHCFVSSHSRHRSQTIRLFVFRLCVLQLCSCLPRI